MPQNLCSSGIYSINMSLIWKSFKGRFLIILGILFLLMLSIAIYTSFSATYNSEKRQIFIGNYSSFEETIHRTRDSLRYLQTSLYSYSLLLNSKYHQIARGQLDRFQALFQALANHQFSKHDKAIKGSLLNLKMSSDELIKVIQNLMYSQEQADRRYPGMAIILNELQPVNILFVKALTSAIDESYAKSEQKVILNVNEKKIHRLLLDLRYAWTQQISSVRLFVANRNGTFGSPKASMKVNRANQKIYASHITSILKKLSAYQGLSDLGIEQSEAIKAMLLSHAKYQRVFKRAHAVLISHQWRTDIFLINTKTQSAFQDTLSVLTQLDGSMHIYYHAEESKMQVVANDVVYYIWLYFFATFVLTILAYLMFEYTIRRPITNISSALEAEGLGETYQIPKSPLQTIETKILESAFKRMRKLVQSRQARLEAILMQAGEGIVIIDNAGVIETFNKAAERDFHYCAEEVVGKPVSILLADEFETREEAVSAWIAHGCDLQKNRDIMLKQKDGTCFPASVNVNTIKITNEWIYVAIIADVSEHKKLMRDLKTIADQDELTQLSNRRYFSDQLEKVLASEIQFGLLYIDLDNFKLINDTFGHLAGDQALKQVALILTEQAQKNHLVARLAGDEFAILLPNSDRKHATNIAELMCLEISQSTLLFKGKALNLACSIGVVVSSPCINSSGINSLDVTASSHHSSLVIASDISPNSSSASLDELMSRADFACNKAKKEGRNRVCFYNEIIKVGQRDLTKEIGIAREIKEALADNRFIVALQPVVDTFTRETVYHEALIRMLDQKGNLIIPSGFVKAAERFGLIVEIDEWMVRDTLNRMKFLRETGGNSRMAINLSAYSISDKKFLQTLIHLLEKENLRPGELTFEIAESVAIENMTATVKFIHLVQKYGCLTALDDFGSGYSSYAYLKNLPIDVIKIDGSFIRNIDSNELNYAMVKSIQEIAVVMGKTTVAEYVDQENILISLQEIGVQYSQGNYLGSPQVKEYSTHCA